MVRIGEKAAETVSGVRKAAILMIMIGPEPSSAIFREMDESEVEAISQEIARVQAFSPEEAERVLEEFYQMSVAQDYVIKGGMEYARKVLVNAFGPDEARKIY